MVTEVKPVQPEKASSLIYVTEFGIVTEVKPVQPLKAEVLIEVTELGIIVFLQPTINEFVSVLIIALQSLRESKTLLPLSTLMLSKPLQPEKRELPISVTELPIVTEVKPVQYWKA